MINNFSIVFSVTADQPALHTDLMNDIIHNVNCEEIIFPAIGLIEFKNALFNATLQSFSDTQVNLLYNLVNGHLQVFFEV